QALTLKVLGPGVSVFGDGPDGGREATFEGPMRFPEPGKSWGGYGIVQAKFKQRPAGDGKDAAWLLGQVQAELERWADPTSKRVRHGRPPRYVLFTTNVVLSAVVGSGGIDRVDELIAGYAERLGLRGWRVWHHDQLCSLLDAHRDVRLTYAALITPSDLVAQLVELLGGAVATVGQRLVVQAAKELTAQRWVRLSEAGQPTNEKLPLSEVAVDLPARGNHVRTRRAQDLRVRRLYGPRVRRHRGRGLDQVPGVVAYLIVRGDTVLRPSRAAKLDPRTVVLGGPGQGKSTLGQLLCQAYRVALLTDRPEESMGPMAAEVLRSLQSQLDGLGIPIPSCRRWPVQVRLSEYGDAIAGGEDVSLLRFLADQLSRHEPGLVTANSLRAWLHNYPWLLVLDGLDEVVAPTVRESLLQHVNDFLTEAASADADLMVVATSRPQGYAEEFSQAYYEHLELLKLDEQQAIGYARRLAAVRHAGDPDTEAQVVARVEQAAVEPVTARLMRSPLQVTIMSLLLERRVRAPQDRHSLFDAYYQTIYEREIAKSRAIGDLLEQQRRNVDWLHDQVGLLLQRRAEHAGDAEALLPNQELHDLAVQRLHKQGFVDAEADRLAAGLVKAATDRLVLLVPRTQDAVGFEVRSLQEFMAARALVADDDPTVLQRLEQLAPSAHWRNTWLLAAGRTFAQREHLRDRIVTLLDDVNAADLLSVLVVPGARLAADVLDDDITTQAPRYRRLFATHALAQLQFPPDAAQRGLADTLREACLADPQIRALVDQALDQALAGSTAAAAAAMAVLAHWEEGTGGFAMTARQRLHRLVDELEPRQQRRLAPLAWLYPHGPLRPVAAAADPNRKAREHTLANLVRGHLRADGADAAAAKAVTLLLERLARVRLVPQAHDPALYDIVYDDGVFDDGDTLSDPKVLDVVVPAVEELARQDWQAAGALRSVLANWLARRPAGEGLPGSAGM
ncbi:MAG TPA: hypothetical protein VG276_01350, partial [Actinomycetes bacterium]|nr:hypothetical protein [Actinomycetes bacterium]